MVLKASGVVFGLWREIFERTAKHGLRSEFVRSWIEIGYGGVGRIGVGVG